MLSNFLHVGLLGHVTTLRFYLRSFLTNMSKHYKERLPTDNNKLNKATKELRHIEEVNRRKKKATP